MSPFRAHLYNRNSRQSERSSLAQGIWATTKLSVFLAVLGVAGWLIFQHQFKSKLGTAIEDKLNTALQGTGIESSLSNAQLFEGSGILLSNMKVQASNISLSAYEILLSTCSHATELVTGKCQINGIELRRVQIEVVRMPGEPFDLSAITRLVDAIELATKDTQRRLVPVAVLDSQVRLIDKATGVEKTFSDINLKLIPMEHEGRTIMKVSAMASASELKRVELVGFFDPASQRWRGNLNLNGAYLGKDLFALLPRNAQQQLESVQTFSGRIDGSIEAEGQLDKPDWFQGQGVVSQLELDHHRLPAPVRNGFAKFNFTPDGLTLQEVAGYLGAAPFQAQFRQSGLLNSKGWELSGRLEEFRFDASEKMLAAMTPGSRRLVHYFQPQGKFDFHFNFDFDGQKVNKKIDVQVSDLSFNYNKFPYPVSDCVGKAQWINEQFTYDLRSQTRDRELSATGFILNPGENATWKCRLNVERGKLLFDEKLRTAIDANPPLAKTVRAFDARGWITGSANFERPIPQGEIHKKFDINLVDMTMRHERFLYTIEHINGKILSNDRAVRFEQLTGSNGDGRVLCNGTWNPRDGLNVRYTCTDILLDEHLRKALRMELREVWDGFRPSGTIKMTTVDMKLPIGAPECNVVVNATLHGENAGVRASDLTIYPTWFPYELKNLAGTLVVGDGKVHLRDFRGMHGHTKVFCNGDGSYSTSGWDMTLSDLLALSLRSDEQLMRALPESLAQSIQYMKFNGLLNVRGTMTLAGQYRKPKVQFANQIPTQPVRQQYASHIQQASATQRIDPGFETPNVSMGWDLRFDMNQAEMFLGIPVENVFGMFTLFGRYDGENVECRGQVGLDSLTIYDAQITKVRGPIWFDNFQALAGGMINQLSPGRTTTPSIEGEMYGGVVRLDAAISSDKEGRFIIQTSLADGDLQQLSNEFSPQNEHVEGRTFAALKMEGNASGSHTCRGTGEIYLRDAKIKKLPRVARVLKLIQVKRVDDVAFDSGDIFFSVNGEDIDISRMEFNGDAISLIGNGRLNLDQDLDLNFYSVVGRNRINIPLISDLYRRSSQKLMWIKVDGNVQDPNISHEILPELNDSIRQLFQPLEVR